jgi:bacterioferritin-associated ferredoxin
MYVCVCNAVTDRQIRAQSECTRGTVAEIYRALGIKVKCGKCVRTAKCIIAEMQPEACSAASTFANDAFSAASAFANDSCSAASNFANDSCSAASSFANDACSAPSAFGKTDNRTGERQPEARNFASIPAFATIDSRSEPMHPEVRDGLSLTAFAMPAFAIPAFARTNNRVDMPPSETRAASAIPTFATAD